MLIGRNPIKENDLNDEDDSTRMIFSIGELIDVVIMTIAVGFIFKDLFVQPHEEGFDPLRAVRESTFFRTWKDMYFAILITAPAIIFHELAHKLVAIYFGLSATFHASYTFLALGVVLKLLHSPFLFFVPGYVSHALAGPVETMAIAFAGPGLNLALWISASLLCASTAIRKTYPKALLVFYLTARINMFLFFFNMLPIPPFDGFAVFSSLYTIVAPMF